MKTYLVYKKEGGNTNSIEYEGREYFFNGGIIAQCFDLLSKQEIMQPFIFQGMNTNIVYYNSKSSILSCLSKEWLVQLFSQLQLLQQQDQFCTYSLFVRGMIEWKQEIFDLNISEREIIKFEPLTKPFLYNNKILLWDEEIIDKIWKPQLMQTKEELQTWLETLSILLSKQNITSPNLFVSFHISRVAKLDPTAIFGSNRFVLADLKDISQFWIKQDELQRNITNGAPLCTILHDFFGGNALNHFIYMPNNNSEMDSALLEKMQVLTTTTISTNPISRRDVSNPLFTFIENRIFKTCRELISKETMFRDALYELKEKYNYITKTNVEIKMQCDEKDELIFKFTNEITNYKKALRDLSVYENGDAVIKDRKLIELTDMYLKSCKDYEQLLIEYNALKKNLTAKKLSSVNNETSNLEHEKKIQDLEQEIINSNTKHEQEIQQAKHQIENLKKEIEILKTAENKQEASLDQMLKELEGKNIKQIEKEMIQWKTKAIMANKQLETMQQYTTQLLKNK